MECSSTSLSQPPSASSSTKATATWVTRLPQPLVSTYQAVGMIGSEKLEIAVQSYEDAFLVILSQGGGKVGCWTQAVLSGNIDVDPPFPANAKASGNGISGGEVPTSSPILALLPPPSTHTILTPLMGSSVLPRELVNLYVTQMATLLWWLSEANGPAAASFPGGMDRERKKVIVGFGLRRLPVESLGVASNTEGKDVDADEDDVEIEEPERRRFAQVMELLAGWKES